MLYICFYNILLRQIYFYSCRKNATQSEINWLWEHKIMKPTTRQGRKPFSARCVSSLSANIYLVTFTHVFSCVNLCYYVKNTKSPKCTTVKVPRSSRIHSSLLDNNTGGNWAMCSRYTYVKRFGILQHLDLSRIWLWPAVLLFPHLFLAFCHIPFLPFSSSSQVAERARPVKLFPLFSSLAAILYYFTIRSFRSCCCSTRSSGKKKSSRIYYYKP